MYMVAHKPALTVRQASCKIYSLRGTSVCAAEASRSNQTSTIAHIFHRLEAMALRAANGSRRRKPKQRRACQTVDAVLDAVVRVLKRDGFRSVTTNRIAEVAGVSIGSVYQYFPDKQAIFVALHQRHIEQIDRMVESKLVEHAASSLEELMRAMIEAMVDAHSADPELYELLASDRSSTPSGRDP